jgi:hypothetical protein
VCLAEEEEYEEREGREGDYQGEDVPGREPVAADAAAEPESPDGPLAEGAPGSSHTGRV